MARGKGYDTIACHADNTQSKRSTEYKKYRVQEEYYIYSVGEWVPFNAVC